MKAWLNLRYTVSGRCKIFAQGLERLGYTVVNGLTQAPGDRDILVTWNRIGQAHQVATKFESLRCPVLVTENATWGNEFAGHHWYTVALVFHNMAGCFPVGGSDRWDQLGVELAPWRAGGETVVLPQRGIGPPETAMPRDWPLRQQGRLRPHPGRHPGRPLQEDLANAGKVVTWGSGAAVKALMWGIPVESHMPNWIGQQDNTDEGRLAMFRHLAWAQWRLDEIRSGDAFTALLDRWKS
jgi:hypothetical protein